MRLRLGVLTVLLMTIPATAQITKAPAAPKSAVTVETVARGLVHPWALQFLPDGRMLVTERPGRLRIVDKAGQLSGPVEGVPAVAAINQGGLLDVLVAPDFSTSRRIYFTFAEPRGMGQNGAAVARARLSEAPNGANARLDDVEIIFRQQPSYGSGLHFGSRLALAPDGKLFVSLGERFQYDYAQDLGRHWGKVVRINTDGSVPQDNPFVGRDGALPEIWTLGHRNPQALTIHPTTGQVWEGEHGPRGGDEVNLIDKGKNYGWAVIGYGVHYSGARIGVGTQKEGMEQPIYYWDPSISPSGMVFYSSDAVPEWKGNLFLGSLSAQHLVRLIMDGNKVVGEEKLLTELGERIRDVRQGPDGALYVLTDSQDGRVIRISKRA